MEVTPFMGKKELKALEWGGNPNQPRPRMELLDLVPENARTVLDIGCGRGILGAELKRRHPACHVTGLERSPDAARLAAHALDLVVAGNLMDTLTTLPANSYEVAIMSGALETEDDAEGLLHEANERLCSGGVLVLSAFNSRHWPAIHDLLEDTGRVDGIPPRTLSFKSLRALLDRTGFTVVKRGTTAIENVSPPPNLRSSLAGVGIECREGFEEFNVFEYLLVCRKA
jgi:precorrin-6B methylase 2